LTYAFFSLSYPGSQELLGARDEKAKADMKAEKAKGKDIDPFSHYPTPAV
jgi:hypothetical protein